MFEEVMLICSDLKERRIFVNNSNELVLAENDKENKILYDDASKDFDVVSENNGKISVLLSGLDGSLIYIYKVAETWEKQIIFDSRSKSKKINNIKLIKVNGWLHAFYCVEYDEKMLFVHHIIHKESFHIKPMVIDYINSKCIYHVSVDDSYNIHIIYAGEDLSLKYKTYVYSSKNYTDVAVTCDDKIRSVNTVFFQDELYCVYLSKEHNYNVINCINLSSFEKYTVGFGVDALSEPCVFADADKLYIEWREKEYGFECIRNKNSKFSKPISLGISQYTLKLRSYANESVTFIDKCVTNVYKQPFSSAKSLFETLCRKEKYDFKIKGSEVLAFQEKSLGNMRIFELETRLNDIEVRLNNLNTLLKSLMTQSIQEQEKDIGEIDEENMKRFNDMDVVFPNVITSYSEEYIDIKEE